MEKRLTALLVAALLLALPLLSLASSAFVPEFGVVLHVPASLDLLTRDMLEDDPLLPLYGVTAAQVRQELEADKLYAKAVDIAGNFTITLALRSQSGEDFGSLDEHALLAVAQTYGGSSYELHTSTQGSLLMITHDSNKAATCLLQSKGLLVELNLTAGRKLGRSMIKTLLQVAQNLDLGLGQ